ncbi:EAL domain-containing protein [Agrobacterium vitis]|uniref:EAL domain-containing protein n=1 Tax=Agrobacterium vitis TaxID=373 RepID=UPI0009BDA9D7|nr:EAL domain-containing protein [Agrobacterium vitis]
MGHRTEKTPDHLVHQTAPDRSFATLSIKSREIVAAIIALCSKLHLRCVLEGVETQEEMAVLAAHKPHLIQGYLFGRPMSGEDASQLIASQLQSNTNQTALQIQSA